ncbi:MAG TPA: hypothetical protein VJT85_00125 [Gemmatimonadaceae bacterium]|nr:hypothetical protein [Gemmatimonadaceae bacterium]
MSEGTALFVTHAAPSCPSATALVRGVPGALGQVLVHTAGRAALLAMGMAIAGHGEKDLLRDALAGAVMLEVLMVLNASRGPRPNVEVWYPDAPTRSAASQP